MFRDLLDTMVSVAIMFASAQDATVFHSSSLIVFLLSVIGVNIIFGARRVLHTVGFLEGC